MYHLWLERPFQISGFERFSQRNFYCIHTNFKASWSKWRAIHFLTMQKQSAGFQEIFSFWVRSNINVFNIVYHLLYLYKKGIKIFCDIVFFFIHIIISMWKYIDILAPDLKFPYSRSLTQLSQYLPKLSMLIL